MDDFTAAVLLCHGGLPPLPSLLPWRGALVIPDALPGIPLGDGARIWTSAYGRYNATWRARIRAAYRARGYTHFAYLCAGKVYHEDYGYLEDDPQRVQRDLIELRTDGLIPVVAACNDQDGGSLTPWTSFVANAHLIPIAFPMWEMNGPLGVADRQPDGTYTGRIIDCIRASTQAAPQAKWYLHFTSGHGAPGYPDERASWRYVRDYFGIRGLLSQDNGYDRNPDTGDPEGTGAGLADTAMRLGEERLENVAFEQCTFPTYNHWPGWDEAHQRSYGADLMRRAPNTVGYCDGGPT